MAYGAQRSCLIYRFWAYLLVGFLFCIGCSEQHAGGNSAESGNPELAGILVLKNNNPATFAKIQCVPSDFNVFQDTLSSFLKTTTDSLGYFQIDSLPEGDFSLEVYHEASGQRLLLSDLNIQIDTTINESLSPTGVLRIGVDRLAENDSGYVYIPGTTFLQLVEIKYGTLFIDSLPAGTFDSLVYVSYDKSFENAFTLAYDITIIADDTLMIDVSPLSLDFVASLEFPDNGSVENTLIDFPIALRIDSSLFDFDLVNNLSGRWNVMRGDFDLPISLARIDKEKKEMVFWARIDSLLPTDSITLHYREGLSSIFAKDVFSESDGYIAVWHFDEGDSLVEDAMESQNFPGEANDVKEVSGVVGKAFLYNGVSSYVSIPNSATGNFDVSMSDTISISVWARIDTLNTSRFLYGKGITQYHLKYLYPYGWLFEEYEAAEEGSTRYWYMPDTTMEISTDWTLLTVSKKGPEISFYINDSLITKEAKVGTCESERYTENLFEIGRQVYPLDTEKTGQYFYGAIDELHVSFSIRKEDWVKATYWNQRPKDYWPRFKKD